MKNALKWIFGILFLLAGLGALFTSPASGVVYLFLGLFLIPPILESVEKKFNFKIPSAGKWVIVIAAIFIAPFLGDGLYKGTNTTSSYRSDPTPRPADEKKEEAQPTTIGVGQVLRTEYFDVTVNKASTNQSVRTGNQFADKDPEQGILYLILNVTYKNTDNESRMISDGSVFINYNGKMYEYDKAETIMLDGWGILLDQINPLTSKTTNIVYKIPAEIKGSAYYEPGRNYDSKRIYLGDL